MKNIILSLSVAYLLLTIGCATPQFTYTLPVDAPTRLEYKAPTGIERTANVGESIVESPIVVKSIPAFRANQTYQPPKAGFTSFPVIYKDSEWKCPLVLPSGHYACERKQGFGAGRPMNGSTPTRGEYYITVAPDGELNGWIMGSMSGQWSGEWSRVPTGFFEAIDTVDYPIVSKKEFKQELLYNGKSKDTIRISYREFSNNLARPAFTQDLMYDLSESKIISFRNVQIEVIEATNSFIRYKIIKQL